MMFQPTMATGFFVEKCCMTVMSWDYMVDPAPDWINAALPGSTVAMERHTQEFDRNVLERFWPVSERENLSVWDDVNSSVKSSVCADTKWTMSLR